MRAASKKPVQGGRAARKKWIKRAVIAGALAAGLLGGERVATRIIEPPLRIAAERQVREEADYLRANLGYHELKEAEKIFGKGGPFRGELDEIVYDAARRTEEERRNRERNLAEKRIYREYSLQEMENELIRMTPEQRGVILEARKKTLPHAKDESNWFAELEKCARYQTAYLEGLEKRAPENVKARIKRWRLELQGGSLLLAVGLAMMVRRIWNRTRLRPDWLVNASRRSSDNPFRVKLERKGMYALLYERNGKIIMSVQEDIREEHGVKAYPVETRVYSPDGKFLSRRKA